LTIEVTYVTLGAFLAQQTLMASFIEAVGESVNRAACVVLGNFAASLEVLQYVLDPLATAPNYNGAAAVYAQRCGLPLPPDFLPSAGFSGGQCPVPYSVSITWTRELSVVQDPPGTLLDPRSATVTVAGAIEGLRVNNAPNVAQLFLRHAGTETTIDSFGVTPANDSRIINATIVSVTRPDGLPDNCGNPTPPTPVYEPGSNSTTTNVTYEDNDSNTVTIPVVIAFGYATVNLDGTINVPITANFELNPELNFNADFNLSTGGLTIDLGNPSRPRPSACSDPNGYEPGEGIPDPPIEIPDAEPPETPPDEPPNPEKVITACIVTTATPGANESVIEQDNDVDIYVPALGYVQFLIRAGNRSAWTNDIPVKNKRCFIPCPWEGGAIDVRGTGRYENPINVTPVYGISQISNGFPD